MSIGRLTVPDALTEIMMRNGLKSLPLEAEDGLGVAKLPMHHRGPVRIHKKNGRIQEERTYPRKADPRHSKG